MAGNGAPEVAAGGRPLLVVQDALAWEQWLEANHEASPGVRLAIPKKGGGGAGPTAAEALEVALCFGWIDSRIEAVDATHYAVHYTPRRPGSLWSQRNRDHIRRLTEQGRMRAAGLAHVEAAKADGRWAAAYAPQSSAEVPEDLAAALQASPDAQDAFDRLDGANRYAVLWRVTTAKRPDTRTRRIQDLVAMLARGEVLHPARGRARP